MIKSLKILNIDRQKEIEMNAVKAPFILEKVDFDFPTISMESYRVPYQIGQTLSGVMVGTRKPTITGYVVADLSNIDVIGKTWNEYFELQEQMIEESKMELNKIISVFQDVRIQVGEYFLDARPTQPPKYSTSEQENNEVLCLFTLEFECYNPLFYKSGKLISLASVENNFMFPLVISESGVVFGTILKKQSMLIENNGDAKTGCEIIIKANGGTVQDPKIYNVATGEYIGFDNVLLEDGDYIKITTQIKEENAIKHDVSESEDISLIGNVSTGSKYLQIEQGSNYYAYTVDEAYKNNIEVTIEFTERYFNIKGM